MIGEPFTIPESALRRCLNCGELIPSTARPESLLVEVVGFTRPRDAGGANHVIARSETGRLVGDCCAARVQAGMQDQATLWDPAA